MSVDVSEAVRIVACHLPIPECPDSVAIPVTITARDLRLIYAALQEGAGALPASPSGGQGSSPSAIPTEPLEPLLAELERLALAATPGEWGVEDPMNHCLTVVSNPYDPVYDWKWIATCAWPDEDDHLVTSAEVKANAAFIAAANPATVLKLIAAVRARAMGMEARQSRNAPQPSPEPRDREEG